MFERPREGDYPAYYSSYISLVRGEDVLRTLEQELNITHALLQSVGEKKAGFQYARGKWSIKEVVGHLIDTERIFACRALHFARGESQPLIGFEQDDYVREGEFDRLSLADLLQEFQVLRQSNIVMFRNFPDTAWDRRGVANEVEFTLRALPYIICGHEIHHRRILEQKYLKKKA